MNIVGLDLSLTATGYADYSGTSVITTKARGAERLGRIRGHIAALWMDESPDLVVVEGYSYGSQNNREVMGELGGVIRLLAHDMKIPVAVVPPTVLKKFATGIGNADKIAMIQTAVAAGAQLPPKRRSSHPENAQFDDNAADAWWLRLMGTYAMDLIDGRRDAKTSPKYRVEAVETVVWP